MSVVSLILLVVLTSNIHCIRNITIYNKCTFTIWPGIHGPGNPANGGFRLDSGQSRDIEVEDAWSRGKIWARTGCDDEYNCETGFCRNNVECNGSENMPPVSFAQFTLKWNSGPDMYDVSLEEGYNIPVRIEANSHEGCKSAGGKGCVKDINAECPDELSVYGRNGNTVACKSGCLGYNTPEECCRGEYHDPRKCHITKTSQMFKDACPATITYPYDTIDEKTIFKCEPTAKYTVQFC